MDHKGDFPLQSGQRCHALTVLDDHSRFNLVLDAADNQRTATVQAALTTAFAHYGLPEAILCDNGATWRGLGDGSGHTPLTVWLLRLGIRVLHGRPYHPQTQGKEERFHRTLEQELLVRHTWRDLPHCAKEFARFRQRYNHERPHDSVGNNPPASRYRPSVRPLPAQLPALEYDNMEVRVVRAKGAITFRNQTWAIGQAFAVIGNLTWVYTDLTGLDVPDIGYLGWTLPYGISVVAGLLTMIRAGGSRRALLHESPCIEVNASRPAAIAAPLD